MYQGEINFIAGHIRGTYSKIMLTAVAGRPDLETLVKVKLPPLPGSVLKIASLLQDYNVSQKAIAAAIGYDPMLAARVLRLANSPVYGFQQQMTNLTEAVGAVGNRAIYNMTMIGVVADSFAHEIRNSAAGRDIWLHSLATGFAARELGITLNLRSVDEAFTCGLLHDIGELLLFRADPKLFAEISGLAENEDTTDIEKEVLGFDHAQLGALAARRWNLPEAVCNMILYHHDPTATTESLLMTNLINIADRLSYRKNRELPIDESFMFSESVIMLRLDEPQLEAVWEKVLVNMREVVKAFFR